MFQFDKIVLASILGFILVLSSCATSRPEGKTTAEVLYKEAVNLVEDHRYLIATEKLNKIKTRYPYSFFATSAELLLADIHFKQENFIEAAAAYGLFKDFHPRHEKMEYVIWQLAESYFFQLPSTFDRDLSMAEDALRFYIQYSKDYPLSENFQAASKRIDELNHQLKSKELYIADFYYRTDVFQSAIYRYLQILEKYNDEATKELAQIRLISSAYQLKDKSQCLDYSNEFTPYLNKNTEQKIVHYKKLCEQIN